MRDGAQADDDAADDGDSAKQGKRTDDGQRLHVHQSYCGGPRREKRVLQ